MKGLKCRFCLLSMLFVFLSSLLISQPANAVQLTDGTTRRVTNTSYLKMTDGSSRHTFTASYGLADTDFQNLPANYYVDNIRFNLSSYIPANNIFTFTIHYRVKGSSTYTAGIEYFGWSSGSSWTLLNDSCIDPGASMVQNTSTWETTLTCTYTGFTNVRLDYIDNVDRTRLIRFLNPDSSQGWANTNAQITVGYIDSRTINWNGLTQDDRDWLESVLPDGTTISDVQTGVENALESQSEAERQELEDSQDDAQDSADEAGAESEAQGQTFVQIVSGFVSGLENVQPSNCVIDLDLSLYHGGTHNNVDLCPSPRPARVTSILTTVGNILLAVWIIREVVVIIEELLYLYREAQE